MFLFVTGAVATVAGLGLIPYKRKLEAKCEERPLDVMSEAIAVSSLLSKVLIVMGIGMALTQCWYTQDVGEAVVLRNFGGSIAGQTDEAGLHVKAPWTDALAFDTRNNLINYHGSSDKTAYAYGGGSAEGPYVTVNDSSGAKANVDIQVVYSLDAETATYLYEEYGTQESFTKNYAAQDLRSVTREVAGGFDTISLLTKRGDFTAAVEKALSEKWKAKGLTVEQVSVQDISYDSSITDAYADAQKAEVEKSKAQNAQETAKVEAETKRIEAEGEAQANKVLSESLTDEVLQQRYIEALKEIGKDGNLVVVPEGTTPVVTTGK